MSIKKFPRHLSLVCTIPWNFGGTTYTDDTAAGGGGITTGTWYLRTTGELAQKL